jgi:hypothetical protein
MSARNIRLGTLLVLALSAAVLLVPFACGTSHGETSCMSGAAGSSTATSSASSSTTTGTASTSTAGAGGMTLAWGNGLVECSDQETPPGANCERCSTLPLTPTPSGPKRLVQCNFDSRIANCGGPVDGGPGPTTDCRHFGCVCGACFIADPAPCQFATYCGAGEQNCDATHPCEQPLGDYTSLGVTGIGCYAVPDAGTACLWSPAPPSASDCADGGVVPPF